MYVTFFRQAWTSDVLSGQDEFRVTSYNILADLYADSDYSRTVLFAQVWFSALIHIRRRYTAYVD